MNKAVLGIAAGFRRRSHGDDRRSRRRGRIRITPAAVGRPPVPHPWPSVHPSPAGRTSQGEQINNAQIIYQVSADLQLRSRPRGRDSHCERIQPGGIGQRDLDSGGSPARPSQGWGSVSQLMDHGGLLREL